MSPAPATPPRTGPAIAAIDVEFELESVEVELADVGLVDNELTVAVVDAGAVVSVLGVCATAVPATKVASVKYTSLFPIPLGADAIAQPGPPPHPGPLATPIVSVCTTVRVSVMKWVVQLVSVDSLSGKGAMETRGNQYTYESISSHHL